MSTHENRLPKDDLLDRACAALRQEAEGLDGARTEAALERVRERLGVAPEVTGRVLGCADIQRLLPAFLAGTLASDRELLVADHTRTCIACRRALKALESPEAPAAAPAVTSPPSLLRRMPRWAWAAAAAVVVLLGVQVAVVTQLLPGSDSMVLRVLRGEVIGVGGDRAQAFGTGAEVPYGEELVTPRGQSALVRLADGSVVEIKERTRLTVFARRAGTTLDLSGGNLIVEAATQQEGRHLWVDTGDCRVQVVGTVFAVNHGTRGSRVSVFEGEVRVAQAGARERVLLPGDQTTTSPRVRQVALAEEVEWSAQREKHLALLAGVALLQREMAALPAPEPRFASVLLDRLPATTVFYAALPNLSRSLDEGLQRLQARLAQDPELAGALGAGGDLPRIGQLLDRLAAVGGELGDELVAAAWTDAGNEIVGPVVLAPVANPANLRARLEAEIAALEQELEGLRVVIVDDPAAYAAAAGEDEEHALLVWIGSGEMAVAHSAPSLAAAAAAMSGTGGGFAGTSFHATIAERYASGVDSLLAVDLAGVLARHGDGDDHQQLERLGFAGVRHLIAEQWADGDTTRRQAVLSFDGERQGIPSWLAAPAPMGALDLFSSEATTVMSFVVKEPALLIEDVLAALTAEERERFAAERAEFTAEHGWDPIEDLAMPLGGEIAFGIDGPLAPEPSWKLVVEVYDPARLQTGIERLVVDLDRQLRAEGEGTVALAAEGDGWVVTRTKADSTEVAAHYRYVDGYLVATASPALLDRAVRYRESGQGLLHSAKLRSLLPPDAQVNLSALWYSDLSGIAGALGSVAQGAAQEQLPPELQRLAAELGSAAGPTVVFAYGEADSIRLSSSSPRSPLGLADLFLLGGAGMNPLGGIAEHHGG